MGLPAAIFGGLAAAGVALEIADLADIVGLDFGGPSDQARIAEALYDAAGGAVFSRSQLVEKDIADAIDSIEGLHRSGLRSAEIIDIQNSIDVANLLRDHSAELARLSIPSQPSPAEIYASMRIGI